MRCWALWSCTEKGDRTMKQLLKRTALLLLVAVMLLSPAVTASAAQGKWIQVGTRYWYRHSDNTYTVNGWEKINGEWYRFDKQGWMQTGWVKEQGNWYYLYPSGRMATGYVYERNGDTYYTKNNGKMVTGWWKIDGRWHYFYPSGKMARATEISGYCVDAFGVWIECPGLTLDGSIIRIQMEYRNKRDSALSSGSRFSFFKGTAEQAGMAPVITYLETIADSDYEYALADSPRVFDAGYVLVVEYDGGYSEHCYIYPDGRLYCDGFVYQTDVSTVRELFRAL